MGAQDDEEANRMLDLFESVGVARFDLTLTDCQGNKTLFRKAVPLKQMRQGIPELIYRGARQQENVILRPHNPPAVFLVQLDDLDAETLPRAAPAAFLTLQTSTHPDNFQAWVAIIEGNEDFARRLRKGVGADRTASGATRAAGSHNFKAKYAPHFPRVRIDQAAPCRRLTVGQLEALGLAAPPEIAAPPAPPAARSRMALRSDGPTAWPSYPQCLQGAPFNRDHSGPDTSRADFTFCLIALDWGWSIEATAARLMQESHKARQNGERYALRTAQRAAEALARRTGSPQHRP